MVSEIARSAKSGMTVSNYLSDSLLRPVKAGESHADRVRTIEYLVQQGSLVIQADKFQIVDVIIPEWLTNAAGLGFEDAYRLAEDFTPTEASKLKFDHLVLTEIGLKGELAFIDFLRAFHGDSCEINHVSLFDDSLGYDVVLRKPDGETLFFEVKTTSRPRDVDFPFYLSRNEYNVGITSKSWTIACMLMLNGTANCVGVLTASQLEGQLPLDVSANITWSNVRVKWNYLDLSQYSG
jgi:hypothetical protein